MMFPAPAASIEHIRQGLLRPLAVTTATRWEPMQEIPTIGEFIPGYEASTWFGICAPKQTPVDIIERLNKEINAGLADPKMKARLADLGGGIFVSSPQEFGTFLADETKKWARVVRAAKITVQ
jgi:tripartite-type tricarboxylate transporter receptor subunit TctC